MKIENIELYYLSMPQILDEADGSQDALLVKVEAGGLIGWDECEASPLTSIANFICPKSHSAANPIITSIIFISDILFFDFSHTNKFFFMTIINNYFIRMTMF